MGGLFDLTFVDDFRRRCFMSAAYETAGFFDG
jgi:hypothetical protein